MLCDDRPVLSSYNRLRGHLRFNHGVHDRDFVFERDEHRFRHPFLYRRDNPPNTSQFPSFMPNGFFGAGDMMQMLGSAISEAVKIGNQIEVH